MYKKKEELKTVIRPNFEGKDRMYLTNLADFDKKNPKIKTFSLARLKEGEEVGFHTHEGEGEYYYIISGRGLYNDNGTEVAVEDGYVTLTPSGEGHALKNTGEGELTFIALILED